jgi:hypothetical protein
MKVNAEVGVCNIQSQLQYSAVKQLASDYQKVKAQVTTALMTAGESKDFFFSLNVNNQYNLDFLFPLYFQAFFTGSTMSKWVFLNDRWREIFKSGGFEIVRLDIFRHYNDFS